MNSDSYQFLVQLFFSLVPEQKSLEDLPELEAEAQAIIHQIVSEAKHGTDSSEAELRQRLNAKMSEIVRLTTISRNLRFHAEKRAPDRWVSVIGTLLGNKYPIGWMEFEEKYEERVETAIREAFPETFASAPPNN